MLMPGKGSASYTVFRSRGGVGGGGFAFSNHGRPRGGFPTEQFKGPPEKPSGNFPGQNKRQSHMAPPPPIKKKEKRGRRPWPGYRFDGSREAGSPMNLDLLRGPEVQGRGRSSIERGGLDPVANSFSRPERLRRIGDKPGRKSLPIFSSGERGVLALGSFRARAVAGGWG